MILVSKSCLLVFIKIRCVFSITGRWLAVRYGIQNFCESNVWKSFILLLLLLLLRCSLQRYFGRAVGMSENPSGASSNVVGITCLPGWNSVNWPAKIGRGGGRSSPLPFYSDGPVSRLANAGQLGCMQHVGLVHFVQHCNPKVPSFCWKKVKLHHLGRFKNIYSGCLYAIKKSVIPS